MKDGFVKVAAASPALRVADVDYNVENIIHCIEKAAEKGAKVLVFPELCVTGATCGDLFFQRTLLDAAIRGVTEIAKATEGRDMLVFVGAPMKKEGMMYNCAFCLYEGKALGVIPKTNISQGEKLHFAPYTSKARIDFAKLGLYPGLMGRMLFPHKDIPDLTVACEIGSDLFAPNPPSTSLAMNGATIIVNPFAEADYLTRDDFRRETVKNHSARLVCGYILAGAGDGESTTDGVYVGHCIIAENGEILAENDAENTIVYSEIDVKKLNSERIRMGGFNADDGNCSSYWGTDLTDTSLTRPISKLPFVPDDTAERTRRCERALLLQCLGLKKRVQHTNAAKLVVGVSGGLDSTLAMLVCARTLKELRRPASDLIAVTMPGFGTTDRTKSNAQELAERLGADFRTIPIGETTLSHFRDIGHDPEDRNVVYENAQARERTQVLMDLANSCGGLVVGTGDLSELALGWATFNGDHMSMYCVNGGIPKTMIRFVVAHVAQTEPKLTRVLTSILETPVSPELLPPQDGKIAQITEDLVGPYELHDFFLYYAIRWGFEPKKVYRLAKYAFDGSYSDEIILKWLKTFYRRFFSQQFKRNCLPDGPAVGSLSLSPRGGFVMPSDAVGKLWQAELDQLGVRS